MMRGFAVALIGWAALGCDSPRGVPNLQRMIVQDKALPYAQNRYLPGGRELQAPPAGTLPHRAPPDDASVLTGTANGRLLGAIPVVIDKQALSLGRQRFDVFCAPCHGVRGDGSTVVASHMDLRKPPSLVGPAVRSFTPGRLFTVITGGYGLMRSYASDLSPGERWAVVAYVQALQLQRGVALRDLPPDLRQRAEQALR